MFVSFCHWFVFLFCFGYNLCIYLLFSIIGFLKKIFSYSHLRLISPDFCYFAVTDSSSPQVFQVLNTFHGIFSPVLSPSVFFPRKLYRCSPFKGT